MIARASSGSRASVSSIEPLISANKAVTVLRSPSLCPEAGSDSLRSIELIAGEAGAIAAGATSAAPQSPQNLSAGSLAVPHLGQARTNFEPHAPQKRLPSRLSTPHLEQRIDSPVSHPIRPPFSPRR